jgi:hypothetical protein
VVFLKSLVKLYFNWLFNNKISLLHWNRASNLLRRLTWYDENNLHAHQVILPIITCEYCMKLLNTLYMLIKFYFHSSVWVVYEVIEYSTCSYSPGSFFPCSHTFYLWWEWRYSWFMFVHLLHLLFFIVIQFDNGNSIACIDYMAHHF